MRILILGGNGMLGHTAWQLFKDRFDAYVSIRGAFVQVEEFGIFNKKKTICGVYAEDFITFVKAAKKVKPNVILNCIGIVKQKNEALDPVKCIEVNSLLPHKLSAMCRADNCRLIHVSTDCVFSGKKGNYNENDGPDPEDLYGQTKLLGEITDGTALTIRTSMIGRELSTRQGLLEWFLSQDNKSVKGYTEAIFSGFTTAKLCAILEDIIVDHADLKGLYHVSSAPINKFNLLSLIKKALGLKIEIIPDDKLKCDHSLDSSKFRRETGYYPPSWEDMVEDMAEKIKKGAR